MGESEEEKKETEAGETWTKRGCMAFLGIQRFGIKSKFALLLSFKATFIETHRGTSLL